jgi:hypothetical protein
MEMRAWWADVNLTPLEIARSLWDMTTSEAAALLLPDAVRMLPGEPRNEWADPSLLDTGRLKSLEEPSCLLPGKAGMNLNHSTDGHRGCGPTTNRNGYGP